ncbi:MAG: indolepyruvate oxidoreductase subunit beta [Spirochaetaceae bacterium]
MAGTVTAGTEEVTNVLMVGVGGQGIIMASNILTKAAMYAGLDAKKSEIHGMSQRGGSVFSHVRFGKTIHSPIISHGEADVLFSLELMETLRWLEYARRDTTIIVSEQRINPAEVKEYPEGVRAELEKRAPNVVFVDPKALKSHIENSKFANVALLGVLSTRIGLAEDAWRAAIEELIPGAFMEGNWNAFQFGRQYA